MAGFVADLYGHQAWADAEHWRALAAHPGALQDAGLVQRIRHIALVQHAFRSIVRGEGFDYERLKRIEGVPIAELLPSWVRPYHDDIVGYVASLPPERLDEPVDVPWFKDPPLRLTVAQALTQAAMHSHYHRAQNATRLREIGGAPPLTDLIVWYWRGRPAPAWD